ncbi:MAG: HAMP domain-containing protein [Bdellovibrionales bacterium]|nr:HAMP domain-containing protein [Bdellovibrionales bacterium]
MTKKTVTQQKFSIRYKFLFVTSALLLFCITAYLIMATTVIRNDKLNLVFDYNRSLVTNISSDVNSLFQNSADKMELVAYFFKIQDTRSIQMVQKLIADSSELVYVAGSEDFQSISKEFHKDNEFLKTYNVDKDFFDSHLASKIPFKKIQEEGEAIWNATLNNGPPLIGYAKSVIEETNSGQVLRHYAVISYIKPNKILKSLSSGTYNEVFLVNEDGEVLIHNDVDYMKGKKTVDDAIVKMAQTAPAKTSVMKLKTSNGDILGGIAKTFKNQMSVISTVSEAKAFSVVDRLLFRSLLFALMIGTLAFIAAIIFSRHLTQPLENLVGGMKEVARGNLTTQIFVKSRDEIRVLAESFNSMIDDLRESREQLEEINRDLELKVKERTLQLEKQNQAVKSAQEALLRTTRLAAVGEIAGRAAHEVLNPLTSILSRVQKVKQRLEAQLTQEGELMNDITQGWKSDYKEGGFEKLVQSWRRPSSLNPEESLWQEDLENLEKINNHMKLEWKNLISDTDFLIKESERINRIVQSMRNLSIVKSEKKYHQLADLMNETVNIMADYASKEDITIVVSQPESDLMVALDKDEFLQSITNMIRNSIQSIVEKKEQNANPLRGLIQIYIASKGENVEVRIEDNGAGIKEEHKKKLFESQFTTKKREQGTGLGLNISRRFIRAFGGDIQLEKSTNGEGAIFLMTLPRMKKDERLSA